MFVRTVIMGDVSKDSDHGGVLVRTVNMGKRLLKTLKIKRTEQMRNG